MNVKQLRESIIDYDPNSDITLSEEWVENNRTIQRDILIRNPERFLEWNIIRKLFYVPFDAPAIQNEIFIMKKNNAFDSRYKHLLIEVPFGAPTPSRLIPGSSPNLIHQVFNIMLQEYFVKMVDQHDVIFEFGGGYGKLRRLVHQLGFKGKYILFDTPLVSALQKYYLSNCCDSATMDSNTIYVSNTDALETYNEFIENSDNTLFVSNWGISEAHTSFRNELLLNILPCFDKYFSLFQDEFSGVDNINYFKSLVNSLPIKAEVVFSHMPKNNIFIGEKLE